MQTTNFKIIVVVVVVVMNGSATLFFDLAAFSFH
jgi:hypothetical protein